MAVALFVSTVLVVEAPGSAEHFEVVCTASPTTVEPGETVTLNTDASQASEAEFDKEGDGTYEKSATIYLVVDVTYDEPGTYQPQARSEAGGAVEKDACGEVTLEAPVAPSSLPAEVKIDPQETYLHEDDGARRPCRSTCPAWTSRSATTPSSRGSGRARPAPATTRCTPIGGQAG